MVLSKLYKVFCIAFLCGASLCVLGQSKRANIWYFGNKVGLDFNFSPPKVLTDGAMNTYEGCASICDKSGALLFYTNGVNIFNKNHQVMSGGFGLTGGVSSTQSVIIVPNPSNPYIYYVFTTAGTYSVNNISDFAYSTVDMSLNGGKGGVTKKNIKLHTHASEKLTAVRHNNGRDIWVITHQGFNNKFFAYLVTNMGVNITPVISAVGKEHSGLSAGALKVSPDGTKLACVEYDKGFIEFYNFDSDLGVVDNTLKVPYKISTRIGSNITLSLYGVEFSPSSKFVYISSDSYSAITQYDLSLPDSASIVNSKVIIKNTFRNGALQLAPDGKIYVATRHEKTTTLAGLINKPDNKGLACDFIANAVSVDSMRTFWGLPNFVQSVFHDTKIDCEYIPPACDDLEVELYNTGDTFAILSSEWSFGDGTCGKGIRIKKNYIKHGIFSVLNTLTYLSGGDTLKKMLSLLVTTYPSPEAKFIIDDKKQCLKNNLFNFKNSSTVLVGNTLLSEWYVNGQFESDSTSLLEQSFKKNWAI